MNNNEFELFHCEKTTIKQKNSFAGYENEGRNINFTEDGLILGTWGGGICKVDTRTKIYDSFKFESTDKISHLRNNVLYSTLNKNKKLLVTIENRGTLEYIHKNREFKRISKNLITKYNTATGNVALASNKTGASNTATGSIALFFNSEGSNNIDIGNNTLFRNREGTDFTATGSKALYNNVKGKKNTAIGNGALCSNNSTSRGTTMGFQAMFNWNNRETEIINFNTAVG